MFAQDLKGCAFGTGRSAAVVFYFTARSLGQRWAFVVRARYFLIFLCVCACVCV